MRTSARLCLLGLVLPTGAAFAEPITLDAWFKGPRIEQVSISPSGRQIAMIVREGDNSLVVVKDLTQNASAKPVLAAVPKSGIEPRSCGWNSETRIVCVLMGTTGRKGLGDYVRRLVAVDSDGSNRRMLLTSATSTGATLADAYAIADYRIDEADMVLVKDWTSVSKLNVRTGILRPFVRPQDPINYFMDDGAGNVLYAAGVPATIWRDKEVEFFARASNNDAWKPLKKLIPFANNPHIRPGLVIPGEKAAYTIFDHEGRTALYKIDLTDQRDPELLYWHEQRDVGRYIYDGAARLLGVGFETGMLGPQYIDPKMAALDTALRKKWPNRWNWVQDSAEDGKVLVVRTEGLSEPPGFFILDTSGQGVRFDAVGSEWPGFAKMALPVTTPALFRTHSGRIMEALFTPAPDTAKKAPLVVFTDGSQKGGTFEPATYFLASRGYAVLRPYFSGSTVDANTLHAPFLDWNGVLSDEVMDAVSWATQRPDVDASRICIIGRGGYGGYTALLAAARKDSPFKCAASLEGFSDLEKKHKKSERASAIEDGRPTGTTHEQVVRESPLRRAADFHMPVLLIENDVRTHTLDDDEGGREMAAALASAEKPHQLVLIKDVNEAYLRAQFIEIEKFLAAHLN